MADNPGVDLDSWRTGVSLPNDLSKRIKVLAEGSCARIFVRKMRLIECIAAPAHLHQKRIEIILAAVGDEFSRLRLCIEPRTESIDPEPAKFRVGGGYSLRSAQQRPHKNNQGSSPESPSQWLSFPQREFSSDVYSGSLLLQKHSEPLRPTALFVGTPTVLR